MMDNEEDCILTPEMEAEAVDRNDDFGRLIADAFTFSLPPFPFEMNGEILQPMGGT